MPIEPEPRERSRSLLIVSFAGLPWEFVSKSCEEPGLPILGRLLEKGVSGSIHPGGLQDGSLNWASLATGRPPSVHGICHNLSPGKSLSHFTSFKERKTPAFWGLLAELGIPVSVVGWPNSEGESLSNGHLIPPSFVDGIAPGAEYSEEFSELRVGPAEIDDEVISALGIDPMDPAAQNAVLALRCDLASDFTIQAVATHLLAINPGACTVVRFPGIERAVGRLLSSDNGKKVLRAYLKVFDAMLARQLVLAGEGTELLILSPFSLEKNRGPGWLLALGETFARDRLIHGAGLLDISPSILAWFGLHIPAEPRARVLLDLFHETPDFGWKDPEGVPPLPVASGFDPVSLDWDWNLARSLNDEGREPEAANLFRTLSDRHPERSDFQIARFRSELRQMRILEATETLILLKEQIAPGFLLLLLETEMCLALGQTGKALAILQIAPSEGHLALLEWKGLLLLRLRQWGPLEVLTRSVLSKNNAIPRAWIGLGEALLRTGKPEQAGEAAMAAIRISYSMVDAHLLLARSLAALGQKAAARKTLEALLKIQSGHLLAQKYLAVLEGDLKDR